MKPALLRFKETALGCTNPLTPSAARARERRNVFAAIEYLFESARDAPHLVREFREECESAISAAEWHGWPEREEMVCLMLSCTNAVLAGWSKVDALADYKRSWQSARRINELDPRRSEDELGHVRSGARLGPAARRTRYHPESLLLDEPPLAQMLKDLATCVLALTHPLVLGREGDEELVLATQGTRYRQAPTKLRQARFVFPERIGQGLGGLTSLRRAGPSFTR